MIHINYNNQTELEVGMFVRTEDRGIKKITNIKFDGFEYIYCLSGGGGIFIQMIKKASYNLIDLIETRDIIETKKDLFRVEYIENDVIYTSSSQPIENNDIISILTHEQFEARTYNVNH